MSDKGCRPHELLGEWAVEPVRFRGLVEIAKRADLIALAQARAAAAPFDPPPYASAGGIALMDWRGVFVKHPTSFAQLFDELSTVRARAALRAAVRDDEVGAIVVRVDSPGGAVLGTSDLAAEVRAVAAQKPLIAYIEDLGASAAVWAISGASAIYANEGAHVGSIGAYAVLEDMSGQFERAGIKVHVIGSAPLKGAGVEGAELTPEQLAEAQRRIDAIATLFVRDLAIGRRVGQDRARAWHTGQVWMADEAKRSGLIDAVMPLDEAIGRARSVAVGRRGTVAAPIAAKERTVRTADVVYEDIRREARTLYPKLTEPRAIAEFTRTPRGADLVRELKAAPAGPPEAA